LWCFVANHIFEIWREETGKEGMNPFALSWLVSERRSIVI
jgi:hypothetical protein